MIGLVDSADAIPVRQKKRASESGNETLQNNDLCVHVWVTCIYRKLVLEFIKESYHNAMGNFVLKALVVCIISLVNLLLLVFFYVVVENRCLSLLRM